MKNFKLVNLFIVLFLASGSVAMTQYDVTPGFGTLDQAIKDNGAGTYNLQAGMWYGLTSIVEITEDIKLIGGDTDGLPAIIQVGNSADGNVFPYMFHTFADFTLKNVFISNQDFSGVQGAGIIGIGSPVRLVIDNCVFDPSGINYTVDGGVPSNGSKLFMTNNQIYRNGHVQGPNDGGSFGITQWDTLWVENNTFVSSGQDFIGTTFHNQPNNKFIWINHNTFLWHDVWIKKSYNDQNFYFTNNLLHDISLFAQDYFWGSFFPDYKLGNTMLSLVCIDTLVTEGIPETLPSDRRVFWEYNLQYNSPPVLNLIQWAKDNNKGELYFIPMLWDEDVPASYATQEVVSPADSSRANRILADDTNWPYMKYKNNWYDIDPMYNESRIYDLNDSAGLNIQNWFDVVVFGGTGTGDGLPSYNWDIDDWNGVSPSEYPVTWPRFDGTYTNTELLTASIEGLPIGDLNWFPTQKGHWEAERTQIQDHILALNEDKYVLSVNVKDIEDNGFTVYPNPTTDILQINSEQELKNVRIYDVSGKLIQSIDMKKALSKQISISSYKTGIYFLKAESIQGDSYKIKIVKE